jgi:hypothetical protein
MIISYFTYVKKIKGHWWERLFRLCFVKCKDKLGFSFLKKN